MAEKRDKVNHRSVKDLRHDIEATRAEMGRTIDKLEGRVSPRRWFDRASEVIRDSARRSKAVDTIRDNPVPTLLSAIGLAGFTWLFVEGNREHKPEKMSLRDRARRRMSNLPRETAGGRYVTEEQLPDEEIISTHYEDVEETSIGETGKEYSEEFKERASQAKEHAGKKFEDVRRKAKQTAEHVGERTREMAEHTKQRGREIRDKAYDRFYENPLMAGLLSMAAGVIAGALLPRTRTEDRYMGGLRDRAVDTAAASGAEVVSGAARTAEAGIEAGQEEMASQQDKDRPISDKVQDVIERSAEASKQEAQQQDVTPEDLRDKAQEDVRKLQEQARKEQAERPEAPGLSEEDKRRAA